MNKIIIIILFVHGTSSSCVRFGTQDDRQIIREHVTVRLFESTFGSRLANGSYVHLAGQTQTQNNISNI